MKTKLVRPVLFELNKNIQSGNNRLFIDKFSKLFINNSFSFNNIVELQLTRQQLILISLEDDKIENGDICYDELNHVVNVYKPYPGRQNYNVKKVIATQDQLSPEYISKFIKEYNDGCVKDVEIEMEELYFHGSGYYKAEELSQTEKERYIFMREYKPKLTNGFITIVEKKEAILYTGEEIISLINNYAQTLDNTNEEEWYATDREIFSDFLQDLIEWLSQNKKK